MLISIVYRFSFASPASQAPRGNRLRCLRCAGIAASDRPKRALRGDLPHADSREEISDFELIFSEHLLDDCQDSGAIGARQWLRQSIDDRYRGVMLFIEQMQHGADECGRQQAAYRRRS